MALDVNGAGTYRLLQACHAQGVARFIYLSTFHSSDHKELTRQPRIASDAVHNVAAGLGQLVYMNDSIQGADLEVW